MEYKRTKAKNKEKEQTKQMQTNTENRVAATDHRGRVMVGGRANRVKGINCMVMNRN